MCILTVHFIITLSDVCVYVHCIGSVIKKARRKGVKVETIKLPPITDFDSGTVN